MKRSIAVSLGGVLVATALAVPGIARAAAAPSEVRVLPAPTIDSYISDELLFAGATGYLHRFGTPWLWTSYADRRTTVVEELAGVNATNLTPAGGDTVVLGISTPGHPVTDTTRQALDLATMTWREVPMGPSIARFRLMGDSLLSISEGSPSELEPRKRAADGSWTAVPVTGVPADATTVTIAHGDGKGALLRLGSNGGGPRYGLLDAATGKIGVLPTTTAAGWYKLSDEAVGLFTSGTAEILNREEILDGTATAPDPIEVSTINSGHVGLAGEDLILATTSINSTGKLPVLRYAAGRTTPTEVVAQGGETLLQGADGVLLTGGTGTSDWSVRKATADGQSVVLPLTAMTSAGVSISTGVVRHTTALIRPGVSPLFRQYATQLGVGAPGTGSAVADGPLVNPAACQAGVICVRAIDGASNGSAYLSDEPENPQLRSVPLGTVLPAIGPNARLVDASPNYRLVNYPNSQDVFRANGTKLSFAGAPASALWFNTMYRAGTGALVEVWNLATGVQGLQPVGTGSPCAKTELQATGKHVYWACADGTAGVVELATRKLIGVPAGQFLLADNYLVRHDANGDLLRYDLTGGVLGEPVRMATFPRGDLTDDRNITWAVDKFGGDAAWVDAGNAVHVVDPGVTPSAPAAGVTTVPTAITLPGALPVIAQLSRPVESTTLTVAPLRSTETARVTGGAARVTTSLSWDGTIGGRRATKGTFRWTLAATVDGASTNVATGLFTVGCGGTPTLHSYECTGRPTLLALSSAATGQGSWQFTEPGPNGTTVLNSAGDESLGALNGLVPFGDISKDYKNDLLIRRSDGSLRAYLGGEEPPFGNKTSLLIPGNWNVYDALIHTGDLNDDGQSDLVARDRESGALFLFSGNGTGGFTASIKIAGGYKGYSRFVGNGDINGDGKADLMMQYDPTSTMYAMLGNGDGTFQSGLRVVGTGWLGYNAVIGAGDLNEDGKNDLVLRDTAGNLFQRLGTGQGTFGDRALIGTGYQQYSSIY
ncbi:VCBS repeat-containing protein [Actinoplanes sp. LDG1-06]|uniref:VCBS repeat-containing protein n=1 Tax=Paractinoplanes ovalisporus TaxID=2810368 RepID=A0ABS2AF92_9ACTN|nr:VCBS repeat-containing protein [Actinoplanes ovalisporus]MBM2617914.1 VCBS repeat-containing protein [Actinoplanes ovalisporus]